MASVGLVLMAKGLSHFFGLSYKMLNVTRPVTQRPRHIIKQTNLSNWRTDDSLAIDRFKPLSSIVGG